MFCVLKSNDGVVRAIALDLPQASTSKLNYLQEVITEGKTIEECRAMLQDAIREMILAYRQQNKEIPVTADN